MPSHLSELEPCLIWIAGMSDLGTKRMFGSALWNRLIGGKSGPHAPGVHRPDMSGITTSVKRTAIAALSSSNCASHQVVIQDSLSGGAFASQGIPWIRSTNRPAPWS